MKLPCRIFGGDKRDDNAKIFAAEKIVKYRAICMALDVSPQNPSTAVPAVQSDPKTKRGNSHQRRRQGRRERRQGQNSSPPRKIVIYRTIRMGLGPDGSNARIAVPAAQSDRRSKRGAPNQRQRREDDKTKNRRHRENREIFYDSHGSWYWHRQLECRGFGRAVRSKFQERRLAGTEMPPKVPRSHFNWRFIYQNGAIFVNTEGFRPCLSKPSYGAPQWALMARLMQKERLESPPKSPFYVTGPFW